MPKCPVFTCTSGYKAHQSDVPIQWFSFPKSPLLLEKWVFRINRQDFTLPKNAQICSRHFNEDEDFLPEAENLDYRGKPRKKRQLKPNAIPSLHMGSHIREGNKLNLLFAKFQLLFFISNTVHIANFRGCCLIFQEKFKPSFLFS